MGPQADAIPPVCTPTDASWLNRIEIFVGILMRKSLAAASLDAVANVARMTSQLICIAQRLVVSRQLGAAAVNCYSSSNSESPRGR